MWSWMKRNPWIWIVFFFLFVLGINLAFVTIAVFQRPIIVE
jgi:hypothetical protein